MAPPDRLDDIVVGEILERILRLEHLAALLDTYLKFTGERADKNKHEIGRLRDRHRDTRGPRKIAVPGRKRADGS